MPYAMMGAIFFWILQISALQGTFNKQLMQLILDM